MNTLPKHELAHQMSLMDEFVVPIVGSLEPQDSSRSFTAGGMSFNVSFAAEESLSCWQDFIDLAGKGVYEEVDLKELITVSKDEMRLFLAESEHGLNGNKINNLSSRALRGVSNFVVASLSRLDLSGFETKYATANEVVANAMAFSAITDAIESTRARWSVVHRVGQSTICRPSADSNAPVKTAADAALKYADYKRTAVEDFLYENS